MYPSCCTRQPPLFLFLLKLGGFIFCFLRMTVLANLGALDQGLQIPIPMGTGKSSVEKSFLVVEKLFLMANGTWRNLSLL